MDIFLTRVTSQAMNYAIRSGITITATYAIRQCGHLLKETPRGSKHRDDLLQLQQRLESKIRIISPAIDMIELISTRGNTSLESAVFLTRQIRLDIQELGQRLSIAAANEANARRSAKTGSKSSSEQELLSIISTIRTLLAKIEDAVPLINLAITTSGVNLSTKLSGTISPSRLLQASTFLTAADVKFAAQPEIRRQVGPTWTLSLYMLFTGHAGRVMDEKRIRETTWKEVVHKVRLKLVRVPLEDLYELPGDQRAHSGGFIAEEMHSIPSNGKASEFAYQLLIIEDLDDDRVHTFDEEDEKTPCPVEEVANAGIRDIVPIHEISKIFYADTGKILNIGRDDSDTFNPVLLLRRDVHAEAPRRMMRRSQMSNHDHYDESEIIDDNGIEVDEEGGEQSEIDAQIHRESAPNTPLNVKTSSSKQTSPAKNNASAWRLPADLDPEWMAFEVYTEDPEPDTSDSSDPATAEQTRPSTRNGGREDSLGPTLTSALSNLSLKSASKSPAAANGNQIIPSPAKPQPTPIIKTSLSLLEMLLKLTSLQQFRQESHLSISDELLNFFLEDASTAGAGGDKSQRQQIRHEAVKRVGFDPYDESPMKRRGEEYIAHARGEASPRPALGFGVRPMGNGNGSILNSSEILDDNDRTIRIPPPDFDFVHPSIERGFSSSPALVETPSRVSRSTQSPTAQRTSSPSSLLATPPSTTKSRQAFVRAQSESNKAGSPRATEWEISENDLEEEAEDE